MRDRETIRKGLTSYKNTELFLYGRRANIQLAKGYCKLHKCYLDTNNLKEKMCKKKMCKYWKEKRNEHNIKIQRVDSKQTKEKILEKKSKKWEIFKSEWHGKFKCGLACNDLQQGYPIREWDLECQEYCREDFFEKYGCMYVHNFLDY